MKSSSAVGTARHRFRLLAIISVLPAMEDEIVLAVPALAVFSFWEGCLRVTVGCGTV